MKETNSTLILDIITQVMQSTEWTFFDNGDFAQVRAHIFSVYVDGDSAKENTLRIVHTDTTYISSKFRCTIIRGNASSYFKFPEPIVKGEDLTEDIIRICMCYQYADLRLEN